jgi:hypothetical protein
MKKLLLILIIVFMQLIGYSQTLSNSTWEVYDTTNTFFVYVQFTSDTASYSFDNINYTNKSTFYSSGANFTIIDLPDTSTGGCGTDIGEYTFLIQGNTLEFTPISDLCISRTITLSSYYWVNLITSIQEHTTNKELLKVTDLLGRETKGKKNEPLFYIYDDGTVEKRIVID